LNAILASTEACRLEVDEEGTAAQFLDRISEAADRGTSLTRNVLEKLAEEPERSDSADVVEVEPVVRETLELLAPLVPPDIHLEFEAWSEPMGVRLQREHLEEILFNLVQNALDAIEGEGRIAIRTSHTVLSPDDRRCALGSLQAGRYVEIVVEDTGEGMTSDVQEQVSHAFFTTRNDDSSGLGGWIVTRLVERWDGWIGYESEPGEGTTVSILLPRADTNRLDCSDSSSIAAAV
jgi:signal transduction histidine kinase